MSVFRLGALNQRLPTGGPQKYLNINRLLFYFINLLAEVRYLIVCERQTYEYLTTITNKSVQRLTVQ